MRRNTVTVYVESIAQNYEEMCGNLKVDFET